MVSSSTVLLVLEGDVPHRTQCWLDLIQIQVVQVITDLNSGCVIDTLPLLDSSILEKLCAEHLYNCHCPQ